MIRAIGIVIFVLSVFTSAAMAESGKAELLDQFQLIQSQILDLAKENTNAIPKTELTNKLDKVIHSDLMSEQLFRLGITFYLSGEPRRYEDSKIDNVFFYASTRCALLLSGRAGEAVRHYLERMKLMCNNDVGDTMFYDGLLEKQKDLK